MFLFQKPDDPTIMKIKKQLFSVQSAAFGVSAVGAEHAAILVDDTALPALRTNLALYFGAIGDIFL